MTRRLGDNETREARPPGDAKLCLLLLAPGGIREFELPDEGTITIGRSPSANVYIEDESVSRMHARLEIAPGSLRVADLGSRNGTTVNGEAVGPEGRAFSKSDALCFGSVGAQLAHLHGAAGRSRWLAANELDSRILAEAERCMLFDRSLTVLAVEIDSAAAENARVVMLSALRLIDVAAPRSAGRIDALLLECDRARGVETAKAVSVALERAAIRARIGVAVFPGDAPSPEAIRLAAEIAMKREAPAEGVVVAKEAVRVLQIGAREVVVADPAMVRLFALIERAARVTLPILVSGETGSGKEITVDAVHALGPRAGKPLVKVNCAAIPEGLLESELFGHESGAFSGASGARAGLFEQADGGTLFLDEIGEMGKALQAKILRVLEDRVVRRVGGASEKVVDVRIVAATHRDLRAAVNAGEFREDLYYRLNALPLKVPPLRERRSEILVLAERFAAEAAREAGRPPISIGADALRVLEGYRWPGNIRELRNAIGRAVVICAADEITVDDLPAEMSAGEREQTAAAPAPVSESAAAAPSGVALQDELREIERRRIVEALEACAGNQSRAAEMLEMPRRTLVSRIAALGIKRPRDGK